MPSTRKSFLDWLNRLDDKAWYALIITLSLVSSIILWLNVGRTWDSETLKQLWLIRNTPQSLFHYLIYPFAQLGDGAVLALLMGLNALTLCLFVKIATSVGIGRGVSFCLYLLLNFSPEYNDTRLVLDAYLFAVVLWLISLNWFLNHQEGSIYKAFLGWAIPLWLAVFFDRTMLFWVLGFPLCFLLWPSMGRTLLAKLVDRGKFLLIYYVLILVLVMIVPFWREAIGEMLATANQQFATITHKMTLVVSGDQGVDLDFWSALLIAIILNAINILQIAGILVLFILWWTYRTRVRSVLALMVQRFFIYCFVFSLIIASIQLLYQGHFSSNLHYQLSIMLLLWLSASGVFYCLQRLMTGALSSEKLLVLCWVLLAYVLASLIQFGPSASHRRAAGEWVKAQHWQQTVKSNSAVALYYADQSPFAVHGTLSANDPYWIWDQNRKYPLPEYFLDYEVLARFSNRHGDTVYVLKRHDN